MLWTILIIELTLAASVLLTIVIDLTGDAMPDLPERDDYFARMRTAQCPDADRIIPLIRRRERLTNPR